jgi:hypothetical protein
MESLAAPVRTPTLFLLGAGLIMVVTLWFSKKARSVTATTVDLSRQEEGTERFQSSGLSRAIVSASTSIQKRIGKLFPSIPDPDSLDVSANTKDGAPAFDVGRASVNLTMASILIAFGTSLKLPLSTTYVSFMVAMGTSLADKAWDRDSAVYRITGVINVIGGWFMTAIIAFTVSGFFAYLIYSLGVTAVVIILLLAVGLILHGIRFHRKEEQKRALKKEEDVAVSDHELSQTIDKLGARFSELLEEEALLISDSIKGLVSEDRKLLTKTSERLESLGNKSRPFRNKLINSLARIESRSPILYVRLLGAEQDLIQSTQLIVEKASEHVVNFHKPLKKEQSDGLTELISAFTEWMQVYVLMLGEQDIGEIERKELLLSSLETKLNQVLKIQIEGIRANNYSKRNSRLVIGLLIEIKDMTDRVESIEGLIREVKRG